MSTTHDIYELLQHTSRTFGLSIPLLPEPIRREVALAYLVLRIADTLEDADNLSLSDRHAALLEFAALLQQDFDANFDTGVEFAEKWSALRPVDHQWYLTLLEQTPLVLSQVSDLEPSRRTIVFSHTSRATLGMAEFVAAAEKTGKWELASLEELRRYCYTVAGIVGELLTELFVANHGNIVTEQVLWKHAKWFGEGLQLVNILKDQHDDASNGRVYLPSDIDQSEIFALARRDLAEAKHYVEALRQADVPSGYVNFVELPMQLAHRALDEIELRGPGAKIPRSAVAEVLVAVQANQEQDK